MARYEEAAWEAMAASYVNKWHQDERRLLLEDQFSCFLSGFLRESVALQRRALKCFLERHGIAVEFQHVEAVRQCVDCDGSIVSLPGGWQARREGHWLELVSPSANVEESVMSYEYFLPILGGCAIPEAGVTLQATFVPAEKAAQEEPGSLLRLTGFGVALLVRNWLPGDRFRPAHTGSEEKLKRLFSEKKIPAGQRPLWPVVLSGARIVWVRGFPVAHDFAWVPSSGDALRIEAFPAGAGPNPTQNPPPVSK